MRNFKDYDSLKKQALKNLDFKREYDALGPEFRLISSIIRIRIERGWTQRQLAEAIGSKQPVVSRLEGGSYNPSLKFLNRVAKALDVELEISLR
jgi:DNA-binding XRE family transcriptional regulator